MNGSFRPFTGEFQSFAAFFLDELGRLDEALARLQGISILVHPPRSKLPFPEYAIALAIRLTNITYSNRLIFNLNATA